MDELRLGVILLNAGMSLITILVYYFAVYSVVLRKPEYRTGKKYSMNLQGGIVCWIVTIVVAYWVMPSLLPLDPEVQGFVRFFFGFQLLLSSMTIFLDGTLMPVKKRRYHWMLATSVLLASLGLLSQGIPWVYKFDGIDCCL